MSFDFTSFTMGMAVAGCLTALMSWLTLRSSKRRLAKTREAFDARLAEIAKQVREWTRAELAGIQEQFRRPWRMPKRMGEGWEVQVGLGRRDGQPDDLKFITVAVMGDEKAAMRLANERYDMWLHLLGYVVDEDYGGWRHVISDYTISWEEIPGSAEAMLAGDYHRLGSYFHELGLWYYVRVMPQGGQP